MSSWIVFWFYFFWITIFFFFANPTVFFNLILYSELTWICLYVLSILISSIIDDASLLGLSFFLFALAGLEFSLGFMLIILFKNYNQAIEFVQADEVLNKYGSNTLYLHKNY